MGSVPKAFAPFFSTLRYFQAGQPGKVTPALFEFLAFFEFPALFDFTSNKTFLTAYVNSANFLCRRRSACNAHQVLISCVGLLLGGYC